MAVEPPGPLSPLSDWIDWIRTVLNQIGLYSARVNVSDNPSVGSTRRYASTRRERQAEQTRSDVLAAAVRLFANRGFAGTTLSAVADEAGVAVETVYAGFGSKKALLGAAMDVAIVGDTAPVALFDRPEAQRIGELPDDERLPAAIAMVGRVYSGPVLGVWLAMLEAAARDPEVAGWCELHEQRRHDTVARVLEMYEGWTPPEEVVDGMWAVGSMEVFAKLTRQRGWSMDQWAEWIVAAFRKLRT